MTDNIKKSKAAVIISVIAFIIASINLIISFVTGISTGSAVAIFCGTLTIYLFNSKSYKSKKDNESNSSEQMK